MQQRTINEASVGRGLQKRSLRVNRHYRLTHDPQMWMGTVANWTVKAPSSFSLAASKSKGSGAAK
jgi:hypothetical protein